VGGVGLLCAYVISYLVELQITKPIHQLTAGVSEIASGNRVHRIEVHTRDEIGQPTHGVNQIAGEANRS